MKKTFPNKNHKILLLTFAFLILTFAFSLVSCNTTEPRPKEGDGYRLTLEKEDASCTEAWLKAGAKNFNLPVKVNLYLNDSLKKTITLTTQDTVIYDDGLLPAHNYKYRAEIMLPQEPVIKSQAITLTTMDKTSHNFTWQTFTFGGVNGSSALYDVAIINENNIWAVGEIHTAETDQFDSNGVWVQPYNAVHWNGQEWELKRIDGNGYPRRVVYAFAENDVWFDGVIKWDGNEYSVHTNNFPLEPNGDGWYRYAMWGTSSSDFYIVGQHGNIAHYDGSSWEKIESGTGSAIQEIWGVNNIITGKQELYFSVPTQYSVYKMDEQNNIKLLEIGNNKYFRGIWSKNGLKVYVSGFGIVSGVSDQWTVELEGSQLFFKDVKGEGNNNIIAAGANGEVAVFNGIKWLRYNVITANNILYEKVSVKRNTVVAVGETFGNEISGIILIGHRN